jgi:hypothetical protein
MTELSLGSLISLMSIPSALTGFFFWLLQRKIKKSDEKQDAREKAQEKAKEDREKARKENELFLIQGVNASIALSEATARAVQRIPDAHCNGDMHKALEYASKVKHEQKDFLAKQGIDALYD